MSNSYTAHTFVVPSDTDYLLTMLTCQECHAVVLVPEMQAHTDWHAREVFQ